jgi:hypothetical protein
MSVEPPPGGVNRSVDVVKGRVRRWSIEAMVGRMMMDIRKMRSLVRGFRLTVYDDG